VRYTVQAAARAAGVTEGRLRTWERRYGVPSPERSATGRRLYSEQDVAQIRRMAGLVAGGIAATLAADMARDQSALNASAAPPGPAEELHPLAAQLVAMAKSFDGPGAEAVLRAARAEFDWASRISQVLFPALRAVGHGWERGDTTPAQEHFLSGLVQLELQVGFVALTAPPAHAPRLILACPEDERHDIGLLAVRLLLAERGVRAIFLGGDVPIDALVVAVRQAFPDGVCLSATTGLGLSGLSLAATALLKHKLTPRLFSGGPALRTASGVTVLGSRLPDDPGAAAAFMAAVLGAA